MRTIDYDMVLLIHQLIAEESGGSVGLRDEHLLKSALGNIFSSFDGVDLYSTKEEKAAMLGYSLISNHALVDGNKRIGMHIMILFLEINGIHLKYTQNELVEMGVAVGAGKAGYTKLLNWIKSKIFTDT